jgi:hypothetical protein
VNRLRFAIVLEIRATARWGYFWTDGPFCPTSAGGYVSWDDLTDQLVRVLAWCSVGADIAMGLIGGSMMNGPNTAMVLEQ